MYRTADTSIWDDPKVRALSKDGKLLFFYLFTNRLTHVSGIYVVPPPSIAHDTGLEMTQVTAAISELSTTMGQNGELDPLVYWDGDRYVVWVVNMFKHQGRGEKNLRSAAAHLCNLHNTPLIELFIARYPEVDDYLERLNGVPLFVGGSSYKAGKRTPDGSMAISVQEVIDLWNAVQGVKRCESPGETIRRRVAAVISKYQVHTWWDAYLKRIARSDFLCGRAIGRRGDPFVATLYWATGPSNIDRTLAGDFDNNKSASGNWKGKL